MNYRDALRQYAKATDPLDLDAARKRHAAILARRRRARIGVTLALAAAALFALRPSPPPALVSRAFADAGAADLGDAVHVRWDGAGHADGDARTLALAWDSGALDVEVDPGRGVSLTVQTGEATIRVIGTGFDVHRDAFGTAVTVRHGVVGVTCAGGAEQRLEAGAGTECLPVTPAALLGRARAQLRRGDPPETVLTTLHAARVGAEGEAAEEIALLTAVELSASGRKEEALDEAEAALTTASNRRAELLRLTTRLALDLGGCTRAQPYADALAALGEPTPCPPVPR